jgi:uncharacterized membrane protein
MSITKIILGYLLTALIFFIIDIIWLGWLAKDVYQKYLGDFLSKDINWTAAVVFYLIFIIGISIFAIYPAVEKRSLLRAITLGALFGFFTYATYDLTNLATLKNWPLGVVFIDILWGTLLCSLVSAAGFYIVNFLQ